VLIESKEKRKIEKAQKIEEINKRFANSYKEVEQGE
jgi:hypothetical protein